MGKPPAFEVIAGSYEEFLLGYYYSSKENKLIQSFAAHDHTSSVRCITFCDHFLASGGTDDRIFVYDLKTRKQHQTLTHHNSTINCLQFTENHSHLISGSADGVLAIVRTGSWQVEKVWEKAHKGAAILDIAIHSSGKLALTLGADATLCTWNLIKGRQAYIINLRSKCMDPKSLENILWAADGVRFILYGGKYTEIWSIESGGALKQVEHGVKVTSCVWLDDDDILVGYEDGQITVINTKGETTKSFKGHDSRIKSMAVYKKKIATVSSSGQVKIWNKNFDELAVIDAGCRLTCLCIVPTIKIKSEKSTEEQHVSDDEIEPIEKSVSQAQVVEIIEDEAEIVSQNKKKIKRQSEGAELVKLTKKKKKKKLNSTM